MGRDKPEPENYRTFANRNVFQSEQKNILFEGDS